MIASTANPKVKQIVQWQTRARERRKDGVFLAEGFKMFEEAPREWIREVYLSVRGEGRLEDPFIRKKLDQTGYEMVSDDVMRKMADTQTPQGILTVLKQPEYCLEKILKDPTGLYLVVEDLQDPGNLGTILRTAEGAGVTGVILSRGTVDLFNPKTIRATMGSIYRVPFLYADDLQDILQKMKAEGIQIYAAHLEGKDYYTAYSFTQPTAFLIGNEGNGLSGECARAADHYLKIPMEGKLESLNAAVAAALLVYEAKRQRGNVAGTGLAP